MISVNGLEVSFGATSLFKGVSFIVNRGEKVALTGKNGAGKSTLLKIIAGQQSPSEGNISRQNDIRIGYLPQQMPLADTTTLIEDTKKAFSENIELMSEMERLENELLQRDDYESETYARIIDRLDHIRQTLDIMRAEDMSAEMERTLTGLGFLKSDFNRNTSEFSGGWRMRIELAKILLRKPDILLLDEPTNHLDIESIQWLENFLKQKNKTLLLVSHDRAFLDNVTTRTIELNCGKAYDYRVSYTDFVTLRQERLEQQKRAYDNQQKQIAEIKDFIERFRYKATKAVQVQSRIKQLEKIIPIEIDEVDKSHLSLRFPPAKRSGDYPLIVQNVGKSYGEHEVFSNVEFTLKRGDKVAFVGKNGEGKSTLVKCIMNEIPFEGELKIGHNVDIGYFAQNQAQLLDENITVFETVDNVATGDIRTKIKDILGAFMFKGNDVDKKVAVLSGGEKTRLAMIKLLLQPVNFLIMDEPTNHLDMQTKDILKSALQKFDGTLVVVSHDRDFMDGLVSKVYEFGGGKVKEHLGGVYDFLRAKNIEDFKGLETSNEEYSPRKSSSAPVSKLDEALTQAGKNIKSSEGLSSLDKKSAYLLQKENEKIVKKLQKKISESEKIIEEIEAELRNLEEKMSAGDVSAEILAEYDSKTKKLQNLMSEWEENQAELEKLEA